MISKFILLQLLLVFLQRFLEIYQFLYKQINKSYISIRLHTAQLTTNIFDKNKPYLRKEVFHQQSKMLNMRRMLKQGELFKLDLEYKSPNERSPHNTTELQTFESLEQQQGLPSARRSDPQQVTFQSVQQSMAIVVCGAIGCCLLNVIVALLFYFFIFDSVKEYIPFLNLNADRMFLNETNSRQYFTQNQLIAGQLHYARIPVEYWDDRIQMVKSMGLNGLSVNVFWNYHEIEKGKFDFENKNRNLTYFLELASKHNMSVLLRPGPYVSASWDFGGLPARLLSVEGMQIRSSNKLFLEETQTYFVQLGKIIKKFVKNKQNPSGPILMLQVQNEPGFFTQQKHYIENLKKIWYQININCPLYFGEANENLQNMKMYWDNAILGSNAVSYKKDTFSHVKDAKNYVFGGQVYTGWFSAWGNNDKQASRIKLYNQVFADQFSNLLSQNKSFSMYMAHGGTNFGLTAGYNTITSYDYNAPINEQGSPADKYHIFRSLLADFTKQLLPAIPQHKETIDIDIREKHTLSSIFDNLDEGLIFQNPLQNPLPFESFQLKMFNQGIVVYETVLEGPNKYSFTMIVHDFALVYVNEVLSTSIQRPADIQLNQQIELNVNCVEKQCKLQIVVEAMGHISFGHQMKTDKKGLVKFQEKTQMIKTKIVWKYYRFDLQDQLQWKNAEKCERSPCLYYVELDLQQNKDAFLHVKELKKGYVWVNGHNIGRYWNVGPQTKLYCPAVWLNKGKNKILILDVSA